MPKLYCTVCHRFLLQTGDLLNLLNPELGSHDKGLMCTHKHAHASKHFHFDARRTLWESDPPVLSCTPEILCIISAEAHESSKTINAPPYINSEKMWMAAFGAEGSPSVDARESRSDWY